MSSSVRHLSLCAVLLAALLAAAAPVAQATTTSLDATTLRVQAAPGEANAIAITASGTTIAVTDGGAIVANTAGAGCAPLLATPGVTCPAAGVTKILVDAGDEDDTVTTTVAIPHEIHGGAGNDQLNGGPARDTMFADEGDDVLHGGADGDAMQGGTGADSLYGEAGDDSLNGNLGPDLISGGTGTFDTVDYGEGQHNAGVTVTIGTGADDGGPGENDNVLGDIEAIYGSEGPDKLTGTDGPEHFLGEGGDDEIHGLGGNDKLYGGEGADRLVPGYGTDDSDGGGGTDVVSYIDRAQGVSVTLDGVANDGTPSLNENDQTTTIEDVVGSSGNDLLIGDAGPNDLNGADGNDELRGQAGNDVVYGGRGADVLKGGDGVDSAEWPPQDGSGPITVVEDAQAGDGFKGENDLVATDVENLLGTDANDVLRGSSVRNTIDGSAGGDVISGGAGNDSLFGGAGNDTIGALDGVKDVVVCGPGVDKAYADTTDKVAADCESVSHTWGFTTKTLPSTLKAKTSVALPLSCPLAFGASCTLDVKLTAGASGASVAAATLGARRVTLRAGRRLTVHLRLTRAARRSLARRHRLRARLVIQPRGLPRATAQIRRVTLRSAVSG